MGLLLPNRTSPLMKLRPALVSVRAMEEERVVAEGGVKIGFGAPVVVISMVSKISGLR